MDKENVIDLEERLARRDRAQFLARLMEIWDKKMTEEPDPGGQDDPTPQDDSA